mgnify:FL=1
MSWKDNLQDAKFRGVTFDCQRIRDGVERATAEYGYPYVDGDDVADLGRRSRKVNMSAIFFGDDYESRLQTFLSVLDTAGSAELIHPVFGSMPNMQVTQYQVEHDAENPDACKVELSFIEAKPGNPFFTTQYPIQKAALVSAASTSLFDQAQTLFFSVINKIRQVKGLVNRYMNNLEGMVYVVSTLERQITGVTNAASYQNDISAFLSDVKSLFGTRRDKLISSSYSSSGSTSTSTTTNTMIISDWKSLVGNSADTVALPVTMNTDVNTDNGVVVIASENEIPSNDLVAIQVSLAVLVAADLAEEASDILAAEVDDPLLSPLDIEQIVNDVRTQIQSAITMLRDYFIKESLVADADSRHAEMADPEAVYQQLNYLRDMALYVQEQGELLILSKPPLTTKTVQSECNLRLLAFRWYGDHTRADELMRLNPTLRNPNRLNVGDTLYAYAV